VTTVRPFNTFGPRQSPRAVIPTIILQCLNGGEVRLGNLQPTRDFTFIDDTVNGFLCAAQSDAAVGETVNLGTGREISIGELSRLIGQITGTEPKIVQETQRVRPADSEVERLCADASRARKSFGWKPQVTLEEGLSRATVWMKQNMDLHLSRYRPSNYAT
jgi:dTDP-glucose 4,6-dehydratase